MLEVYLAGSGSKGDNEAQPDCAAASGSPCFTEQDPLCVVTFHSFMFLKLRSAASVSHRLLCRAARMLDMMGSHSKEVCS